MAKLTGFYSQKHQLGTHFFERGNPEFFKVNNKVNYDLNLYDLIKAYGKIVTKSNNNSITIAETKLYSVEDAINRLKSLLKTSDGWQNLLEFIPKNIKDKLGIKSALASHFVASLELVKEGDIFLRQDNLNDKILISFKNN